MNGFQLKMIRKNTKPPLWKRLYVPGGITFTQLSFILDEMFLLEQTPAFGFEFYSCKAQIAEKDRYYFRRGRFEYDRFDADRTYIDDYLGTQSWFSYYRNIRQEDLAFRVEIEDTILNAEINCPELVKSVTLKKENRMDYWDGLNEVLERRYSIHYEEEAPQLTHEAIKEQLEKGNPLIGSLHPVNAPLEEENRSFRTMTMQLGEMLDNIYDTDFSKGTDKSKYLIPERIMEKTAWIQRCDYAVTKLYGTCRVDEFCRLCKTDTDLKLEDEEIERLFSEIPEEERYCARMGNRYIRKPLIGKKSYENLIKWHRGKKITYPEKKEIDDLWEVGYPASDPVYMMARTAFLEELGQNEMDTDEYLRLIFDEFSYAAQISEIVPLLEEEGLELNDREAVQTLVALLVMLNNNTRMAIHKGNRPADLSGHGTDVRNRKTPATHQNSFENKTSGMYVSMPSDAARYFQTPAAKTKAAPKIYPNDPCPCGSGIKYKKCCGRK